MCESGRRDRMKVELGDVKVGEYNMKQGEGRGGRRMNVKMEKGR